LNLRALWQSTAVRTIVVGTALTGIATHFDHWAGRHTGGYEHLEKSTIDAGDIFGNGAELAALSGAAWGVGVICGKPAFRRTGIEMMEAFAIDAAMVTALKPVVGRRRPDHSNSLSFPSGHSSGAFAVSTVLFRRGGWALGIPAYGLSALTAMARIEDRKHYLSDAVAGAAIGILVGELVSPGHNQVAPARTALVASPSGMAVRFSF
jgi:membrane-associated phospholipid phosphatase